MENIINNINKIAQQYIYLEFSIILYENDKLIIAASQDFFYYHNFEIHFQGVFAVNCKTIWKANTKKEVIKIVKGSIEENEINRQYMVEKGHLVFKFIGEDGFNCFVIAEEILLYEKVVKYG